MRKKVILTGLLMACASLVCLISAEKSHMPKNDLITGKKGKAYDHGGKATFATERRNLDGTPVQAGETYDSDYLMKLDKLVQKQADLERICAECRLVIDKAGIEDSVYDKYDNPEGRLDRYKVDLLVKKLFSASKELNANKIELKKLKKTLPDK